MLSGCQATPDTLVGDDLKGKTHNFAEEKEAHKNYKSEKDEEMTQSI